MGQKVFGGTFWVLPFLSLLSLWKLGLVPLPLMTVIRQADSPLYSASNPKGPHKHLSCHPPYSIPGHRIKKQHLKLTAKPCLPPQACTAHMPMEPVLSYPHASSRPAIVTTVASS